MLTFTENSILNAIHVCKNDRLINSTRKFFFLGGFQNGQSLLYSNHRVLKCDVIKTKFVKLWDLSEFSERTASKRPTC